jgi:cobalt-zinc-cadmium efflux system outer membrane protein
VNFAPEHQQGATSWSAGFLVSLPLLNRNQGNIARARGDITQSQVELSGLEQQVVAEVRATWLDYSTTQAVARRLERETLPRARHLLQDMTTQFEQSEQSRVSLENARRDYNEVIRQYRDALIRNRRSALRLNTAVASRVLY